MPICDILTLHLYIHHFKNNDGYLEISNNMCLYRKITTFYGGFGRTDKTMPKHI